MFGLRSLCSTLRASRLVLCKKGRKGHSALTSGVIGEALGRTCSIPKLGTEALFPLPPMLALIDASRTSSGLKDTQPQFTTALLPQHHFLRVKHP